MMHDNYVAGDNVRAQQPDYLEPKSSGMVLVVVVIMAAVAGILATGLHFASGSRITQVRQEMRFDKAFFVAEAGIERAKASLRYNITNGVLFGGFTNYGEGRFYVNVQNSASTNRYIIRSTGIVETATQVIEVEVRVTPFTPGEVQTEGAMGIYGTNTTLDVGGNSKIDGNDWNVDDTLSTNPAMPGVLCTSTSTVVSTTGSGAIDGNPPNTNAVGVYDETYWLQFLDQMLSVATMYDPDNPNLGTYAAPTVTMLPSGETLLNGTDSGAGILIVPGDAALKITGQFEYIGLIILVGDGVIDVSNELTEVGKANIFGSIVCVGGALDISLLGTADIKYSSQALENLENLVFSQPVPAELTMISWTAIKTSSADW
ncbi:MAG: hypothetical protein Q7J98_07785 [Kiritimatiellia bacterium]|nr:hypothetical protein [Kiritimatiellia bacterium]